MKFSTIIFDLDGTLTDTLTDLFLSTNHALRMNGCPERTREEVRQMVGNGIGRLVQRAVPDGADDAVVERCLESFKAHYMQHCKDNTCLYDGVEEMVRDMKAHGYRIAVVSNKVQDGVDALCRQFLDKMVDVAIGERPGVPRKPAPDMVRLAIEALGVKAEECVYIGDSEVDIATARNAGLRCISVLWGFRDRDSLERAGATTFATRPHDVIDLLEKLGR